MINRYSALRWFICPLIGLYIKEIKGMKNLPKKGRAIMVFNHNSVADGFAIIYIYLIRRGNGRIAAITRLKPIKNSKLDKILMDWIASLSNFFFKLIDHHEEDKIEKAVNALKNGYYFITPPEGRINTDSKVMLKARTGTARIALLSKTPIIPIGLIDTEKVLPLNAHFPRFKRLSISIGKPISLEKYYGKENNKKILELITRKFMKEIEKLSGRYYPY